MNQFIKRFNVFTNECVLDASLEKNKELERISKFDEWIYINKNWDNPKIVHDNDVDFKDGSLKIYQSGDYFFFAHLPIQIKNRTDEDFKGIIKLRMVINRQNRDNKEMHITPIMTQIESIVTPSSIIPGEVVLSLQGFLKLTDDDLDEESNTINLQYLCNSYDNIIAVPESLNIQVNTEIGQAKWTCLRL